MASTIIARLKEVTISWRASHYQATQPQYLSLTLSVPSLQKEVEGQIVEKEGFVVFIWNTCETIGDGLIEVLVEQRSSSHCRLGPLVNVISPFQEDSGMVCFHIQYNAILFRPFKNEVIDLVVRELDHQVRERCKFGINPKPNLNPNPNP